MTDEKMYRYSGQLFGRVRIETDTDVIDESNVKEVWKWVEPFHDGNARAIEKLDRIRRGKQEILDKSPQARPSINNKVVVNYAYRAVNFHVANLLEKPIRYVLTSENCTEEIKQNAAQWELYLKMAKKDAFDHLIADRMHCAGVCPVLVTPDVNWQMKDHAPFKLTVLDPEKAGCVYWSGAGNKKLFGYMTYNNSKREKVVKIYTDTTEFTIESGRVTAIENEIGMIPIVEYELNHNRMGVFEPAVPLINALNRITSDSLDSVQSFVDSFDVFQDVSEIPTEAYKVAGEGGGYFQIDTRDGSNHQGKVYRVNSPLDITGVKTLSDKIISLMNEVMALPNRSGGGSTSDTGEATKYRDGWQDSEAFTNETIGHWLPAEDEVREIALTICRERKALDMSLFDVEPKFTRTRMVAMQSYAQVFNTMYSSGIVDPKELFTMCAPLFSDPNSACQRGLKWKEEQDKLMEQTLAGDLNEQSVQTRRQSDTDFAEETDSTEPEDSEV